MRKGVCAQRVCARERGIVDHQRLQRGQRVEQAGWHGAEATVARVGAANVQVDEPRQPLKGARRKAGDAPPAVEPRIPPLGRMINHRGRLDLHDVIHAMREERGEQGGFEWQDMAAVRAGSFGKEQQPVPRPQPVLEQGLLMAGLAAFSRDEDRPRCPCQPADPRPARHLGL